MIIGTLADYGPDARAWALNFGSIALQKLRGIQNDPAGFGSNLGSSIHLCAEALEVLNLL